VMEQASRRDIFYANHHPYTEGLLASLPQRNSSGGRLIPILGSPPSMINPPQGCPFAPRCPYAFNRCVEETPELGEVFHKPDHRSACFLSSHQAEREEGREQMRISLLQDDKIGGIA
jgi:peptide/nickel transport system ATP-binding protein